MLKINFWPASIGSSRAESGPNSTTGEPPDPGPPLTQSPSKSHDSPTSFPTSGRAPGAAWNSDQSEPSEAELLVNNPENKVNFPADISSLPCDFIVMLVEKSSPFPPFEQVLITALQFDVAD